MDYRKINEETSKLVAAEDKYNKYMRWLDRMRSNPSGYYGTVEVGIKNDKRSGTLTIYLSNREMYDVVYKEMLKASAEFIKLKVDYDENQNK